MSLDPRNSSSVTGQVAGDGGGAIRRQHGRQIVSASDGAVRPQLVAQRPHRFKGSLAPLFSWYALHDRGGDALDQGAVEQIRIDLAPDQHLHQEYQDGERIGLIGRNGFNVPDQSVHGGESVCHAPIMAVPRDNSQPTRACGAPPADLETKIADIGQWSDR